MTNDEADDGYRQAARGDGASREQVRPLDYAAVKTSQQQLILVVAEDVAELTCVGARLDAGCAGRRIGAFCTSYLSVSAIRGQHGVMYSIKS